MSFCWVCDSARVFRSRGRATPRGRFVMIGGTFIFRCSWGWAVRSFRRMRVRSFWGFGGWGSRLSALGRFGGLPAWGTLAGGCRLTTIGRSFWRSTDFTRFRRRGFRWRLWPHYRETWSMHFTGNFVWLFRRWTIVRWEKGEWGGGSFARVPLLRWRRRS